MRPDGEPGAVEVRDQALFVGHLLERRFRVGFRKRVEQWAGGAYGALDLPESVAAVEVVPGFRKSIFTILRFFAFDFSFLLCFVTLWGTD